MAKGGRPKWIPTQEDFDNIESLASSGLTKQQIADALGICYDTLNEKSKEYSQFSGALKRGEAKGIANVAQNLIKNVENGNVTAQIFYLKCKAGWKETSVNEITGKDGGPVEVENLSRPEKIEKIAAILERSAAQSNNERSD